MKKILSIIILPSFLLFSCGKKEETQIVDEVVKKYAKTETIALKPFTEELKLTWKIAWNKETNISSQISWTVKSINVKAWDKVKAWDILAQIDTKTNSLQTNLNTITNTYENTLNVYSLTKESIEKDLASAKTQLENAKTTKANTYASTDEQLKIVQTQLDNIKTQVKNTKNSSVTSLDLSQKSYDSAKLSLDNFEKNASETLKGFDIKLKTLNDKKAWLSDTIDTTTISSLATIDSSLTYIDTVLGISDQNKNQNDSYEIYLSAKNTSYKNDAENLYKSSKVLYEEVKNSSLTWIEKLNKLNSLADKVVSLYEKMVLVWENTISSSSFPDSSLTAMKSTIKANQSAVLWIKSGIVTLKNSSTDLDNSISDLENTINTTKISLDTQRASLTQAVSISKATLENTKISISTWIDSVNWNETLLQNQLQSTLASIKQTRDQVDNAVKIAQSTYDSTKAKLDSSLAWVKSQLDNATGQKNSILQQVDNTLIKAPFDWVITSKSIEVWALVNPGTPTFGISMDNTKIIKIDLTWDNVKDISLWNEVTVSKNGLTWTWVITLIWVSADNNTKLYPVEIKISSNDFSSQVILWDFVDVYVKKVANNAKSQIVIPFTSLITWNSWDFYVYLVWSWNVLKSQMIKLWDSNSHEFVVTDWLKVWDKIVTSWTLNLSEGDTIE